MPDATTSEPLLLLKRPLYPRYPVVVPSYPTESCIRTFKTRKSSVILPQTPTTSHGKTTRGIGRGIHDFDFPLAGGDSPRPPRRRPDRIPHARLHSSFSQQRHAGLRHRAFGGRDHRGHPVSQDRRPSPGHRLRQIRECGTGPGSPREDRERPEPGCRQTRHLVDQSAGLCEGHYRATDRCPSRD